MTVNSLGFGTSIKDGPRLPLRLDPPDELLIPSRVPVPSQIMHEQPHRLQVAGPEYRSGNPLKILFAFEVCHHRAASLFRICLRSAVHVGQ